PLAEWNYGGGRAGRCYLGRAPGGLRPPFRLSGALPGLRPHWMEMKTRLLFLFIPLALVAVLAAGCGGGGTANGVPADSIATVNGTNISKATFNELLNVAFARYKAQGQPVPKVGTPAYSQLRDQAVSFLVQEEELTEEGKTIGVTVTQKDIDARVALIRKTY